MADKNTQTGLVEFNISDGKPEIGNWQTAGQAQLSVWNMKDWAGAA